MTREGKTVGRHTIVAPFAGIIRSRFNGSAALLRDTLSLCDSDPGTAGWLPATSVRRNPKTPRLPRQDLRSVHNLNLTPNPGVLFAAFARNALF
jgi:hypothetical protein